ncbi:hypothetical protein TCAL_00546 [Tigriopus californicus]|uniref:SID1 transmembrane family member 1 n=1 Tax=Tigriopus californicus TaxID=6832 RepID=A0A553PB43_TIGCA|nr:SID1 transmembrane family member 1-like [Tigriopus californicus]TRY74898.1 hypothetical protein TCAL_00546 [Tigriopus californicus]|eukprot:TCALIF_00546-PA protein Name:"Similar to SIDT1 SID1 transmembrane family member 1 (Homo sapiens)" AED:0.07 eAED:0.08 QI:0/0/0/1/1/1/2/0/885
MTSRAGAVLLVWMALWSFNGLHAQERAVSLALNEPFLIDVEAPGLTLAFNLPPMSLNASHTAQFQAQFQPDLEVGSQVLPHVTLVLIYGNQSLSWFIANHSRSSSQRLCWAGLPEGGNSVSLVVHSSRSTQIQLSIQSVDMSLPFGQAQITDVALNHPVTFLVDPVPQGSLGDRYLLRVDSQDAGSDHFCLIVAAYANVCPFKDKGATIRNGEMWMTVLAKGAMTIRYEDARFAMPFYVTLLVLESDQDCHQTDFVVAPYSSFSRTRSKRMRVSIERTSRNESYLYPILTMVFMSVLMGILGMCVMMGKKFEENDPSGDDTAPHDNPSVYLSANASREDIADNGGGAVGYDETDELDGNYLRPQVASPVPSTSSSRRSQEQDYLKPVISADNGNANPDPRPSRTRPDIDDLKRRCMDSVPLSSTRRARIEKGLERLNEDTNLGHMTHILEDDPWFRRNRSRVYCYLVPLLALFYFIPSIQFVFLVKESESLTGSQDLCYHNFLCSKPWNIFSDFNHVVSNLPYMIYGFMFVGLVRFKSSKLPPGQNPKNDHKAGKGILQQLSIFYAMGFSLAAQGFFSICYHVCPTNHSLQFDSTMMYVMCMLGCVKIYQFRHPDANANAYSFFYFLGGIVLLEALTLYSYSWWVYSLFLVLYVAMTVFIAIDCYFIGVARLDTRITKVLIEDVFYTSWKGGPNGEKVGIRYPKRFGFAMVFCLINFAYVVYLLVAKVKRPDRSVTHVVLVILAGNLFLYIGYYIFRKNQMRCKIMGKSMCCRDGDQVDASYSYPNPFCPNHRIPIFISAGSIFALLSFMCAVTAITFYLDRSANRNLSPAESRILNEDCAYFNFYDSHDAWHFLSATAIFMAFLALLTVDDDQIHVPRELIEVF